MLLTDARVAGGVWEGTLSAEAEPRLTVTHRDRPLDGVAVDARDGQAGHWTVRVRIPADLLSDGVQTFVVADADSGTRVGHFTIVTGMPLEDDLRAEIDLMRAELDLLKRAFRRHCAETDG